MVNDDEGAAMGQQDFPNKTFIYRILIIVGVAAGAALFLLFFGYFSRVLLLVFAGIMLAVFLRGLAGLLSNHTPFSTGWALVVVAILLLEGIVLSILWLGPTIADSFNKFIQSLPQALEHIQAFIKGHPALEQVVQRLLQREQPILNNFFARVAGIFSTVTGLLVGIVVILFTGIYLSVNPEIYINGAMHLLPHNGRERARAVFNELGHALRRWLVGRVSSMMVVGALVWIGLIVLGIPSAAALAFFATMITFIPYIGPILSAVPAVLVGWLQGPIMVVYIIILYTAVQVIETYLITPLIQREVVQLPPALILTVQMTMGFAFGILGLLLATPLAVVILVLVEMLYVEDMLGDQVKLP